MVELSPTAPSVGGPGPGPEGVRILVVDNYDSFVYNLVQYLDRIGAHTTVVRNDDPLLAELVAGQQPDRFDGILLSPGPGVPAEAGACPDLVRRLGGQVPIFGVCLGMQVIAEAYGARVDRAPHLRHGKTSPISHRGAGSLAGLPETFTATRYHSLAVVEGTVPDVLEVTARSTDDDVIMAVRHRDLAVEGMQFHPESVLSEGGYQMLANWLATCGDAAAPARAADMAPLVALAPR